MYRLRVLLIPILILTSCGQPKYLEGQDGLGDTYFPQLGNAGYDAQHYSLVLEVDPLENYIIGKATIDIEVTQPLKSFNLDFIGLMIDKVSVGGVPANFLRADRELTIKPSQPLREGGVYTVQIDYHGSPQPTLSLGGWFDVGWFHTPENEIYVTSETSGAASWYPVNDHPLDKASYSFEISVPNPYVVAANGILEEVIYSGDVITYLWSAEEPMASYLVTLNIAEYVVETTAGTDGVIIRNYFPDGFPDSLRHGIDQTSQMMAFFIDKFGTYPFAAYGTVIVDMPDETFIAMETQTLSQHAESTFALSESIIAHELAHQWFGNSVSLKNWQDMWLKEGAARYAEWLWEEAQHGEEALNKRVRGVYQLQAWSSHVISSPPQDNLYIDAIYNRGALTFHALRLRVGDKIFFEILQTYLDKYRYGNAGASDFIQIAQDVSGQDLEEFFENWLSSKAIPPIPEMGLDI